MLGLIGIKNILHRAIKFPNTFFILLRDLKCLWSYILDEPRNQRRIQNLAVNYFREKAPGSSGKISSLNKKFELWKIHLIVLQLFINMRIVRNTAIFIAAITTQNESKSLSYKIKQ